MTYDTINDALTMRPDDGGTLGRIDQYELVRELGGGGFGTVYLAKDTVSCINVAVKGLPPFVRNSREEMENIRSNFALVSRLHHPNIAAALVLHPAKEVAYSSEDVRQKLRVDSGDTLMVMEYAPGVTLSKWRKQFPEGKVPLAQALEIVRQVASALDYAHGRRIVHRDIKPANVMIETADDGSVTARVLDFGLAAEIRSSMGRVSREIHDTSGTRPYMAPEQWLGGKQGPETDQYALAALFYELITGEVPFASVFDTGDPVVMMNVVGREPFSPPSGLPKAVRNALAKALAKKPEDRFASCGGLVAALSGQKVPSKHSTSDKEGVAAGRGGMASKALAAAIIGALACGGYFAWVKYDEGVQARKAEEERIKKEVYELKGKASQAREKNEKAEWHGWPHFSLKAKELEGAFRAGESAFEKDDFKAARKLFLNVRDNWYWLCSNKVERAKAVAAKGMAEECRRNADVANAGKLAAASYSDASNALVQAMHAFDSGAFPTAADEFGKAGQAFDDATAKAKKENLRLMAERKKADTEAALAAFRAYPPRYEEGIRLSKTADRDNVDIQFYIGVCHDFGYGGMEKDDRLAVEWYRKAAEQGHKVAQFNLGNMHGQGRGVATNEAEAVRWYRMSADQGDSDAQVNLGVAYDNGCGVDKDYAEAIKWYRKAAEQGNAKAQNNLGTMYEFGRGVDKDYAEAVKWYRKAAEQGNAMAQNNLGMMYEFGRGMARDYSTAASWYRKAAEQGNATGEFNLGDMYEHGKGVAKDEAKAANLYRQAAEQGNAKAQNSLGVMCRNGRGVAKDDTEAVKWYRKAAEQGDANAQNNLGTMYEFGRGVVKDYAEAVKWYRKAAEQGNATGEFSLGDMFEHGKGVEKNLAKARELYQKAAAKGNEFAKKRLAGLNDEVERSASDTEVGYGSEIRCREGLEMLGIDVEGKFRYGQTVRVAPGENLTAILNNCNDRTTIILAKGEYNGNGSVFMSSKSVRIRGEGDGVILTNLSLHLDGNGDANCLLVAENLAIVGGSNGYGIWIEGNARSVVDKCLLKNCGMWVSDSGGRGRMAVARSQIKFHPERGITCCAGTRLYMTDSTILSNSNGDYPVICHTDSRLVIRNSHLKAVGENNLTGIRAGDDGVLFCIENTSFNGLRYGIHVGKRSNGSVIRCKFRDMLYCGIENKGPVETYRNMITGTGKMTSENLAVSEALNEITVNKNMLR